MSSRGGQRKRRASAKAGSRKAKKGSGRRSAAQRSGPRTPSAPRRRLWGWLAGASGAAAVIAIAVLIDRAPAAATVPDALRAEVVDTRPHATDAFTQGLVWHDGKLYESTGRRGRSELREIDPATGRILRRRDVDPQLFAEGLARVDDRLVQLTWKRGRALVWDLGSLQRRDPMRYQGEGWGLCFDGTHLVMSDGTAMLTFRDPESFEVDHRVRVTKVGQPVRRLNELECVDGSVWANIWKKDEIVRIDPESGEVTATVDASGLLTPEEARNADVLNGIAYSEKRQRLLLTGKLWPHLFEIELVSREQ